MPATDIIKRSATSYARKYEGTVISHFSKGSGT